jgi:hypothetical protein
MKRTDTFDSILTAVERRAIAKLSSPAKIQAFLDELPYNRGEDGYFCPASVLREGKAHCYEGAVFAAALLGRIGFPPLLLNMFPEPGTDDEHLLAVFRRHGAWGAVAKSNFVGLRFREPVYRSLHELVMSYFESYYNLVRQKTLRSYARPLDLSAFDRYAWQTRDETMERIERRLNALRRIELLSAATAAALAPVDDRSYQAGLCGSDPAGLFVPGGSHPAAAARRQDKPPAGRHAPS